MRQPRAGRPLAVGESPETNQQGEGTEQHGWPLDHRDGEDCKLRFGVPIVREDEDFNRRYTLTMSHLTYTQQLDAMAIIPVTSLMKVRPFAEYLTTVDMESAGIGIVLPRPEDLYWDALMLEAEKRQ